jgi:hypothetical protein
MTIALFKFENLLTIKALAGTKQGCGQMAFPTRAELDRFPLPRGGQVLRLTATNDRSVRHDHVAMRLLDNPNSYKKPQLDSGCEAHRHNLY